MTSTSKMGWLFGKKKSQVPFPEPHLLDEGALRFPGPGSRDRVFEPEQLKAAAGVDRSMPSLNGEDNQNGFSMPMSTRLYTGPMPIRTQHEVPVENVTSIDEPLFVHIDVYRQVLGSIDDLKKSVNSLQETSKKLETSEYNEEANFTKLRRAVKSMHDRLLHVDKVLFKSQ